MEKILYEERRLQLTQLNLKFLGEEQPDGLDHFLLSFLRHR
jgi:hypothetical protein